MAKTGGVEYNVVWLKRVAEWLGGPHTRRILREDKVGGWRIVWDGFSPMVRASKGAKAYDIPMTSIEVLEPYVVPATETSVSA